MIQGLLALGAIAWVGLTAPVETWRRMEGAMLYQPYVNEIEYLGLGCVAGGAGGALVGSMAFVAPVVGEVTAPFTITKGAIEGCMAGAMIGTVIGKSYNASAFYLKHLTNSP